MKAPIAILALSAGLCSMPLLADSTFKASGSVRARYEHLTGQSRPGFKSEDELISFRTILDAEYDTGLWRFGASLYDSRAYLGDVNSAISTNEVNVLEPAQAYVGLDLDQPFGKGSSFGVLAGRLLMNVGSRRLISADDYRNTTNTNTGLRVDGKLASGWSASAWWVMPTLRLPDDINSVLNNEFELDHESNKAVLWGALVTSPRRVLHGAVEAMYLKFREADTPTHPTRDRALDNWSLRWYRDAAPGAWDYEAEVILQDGRARTGIGAAAPLRDVDASMWALHAAYSWQLPWKPRLALEYLYASGDAGTDKIRRFDTLFGSRRNELAPSGLYAQLARTNIDTAGLRLELAPSARSDLMATWKYLLLASATDSFSATGVRDPSGQSGDYAGQQLDLRWRYWILPKQLRFEADTVVLFKGRFLQEAPNARAGDTRFYSLNVTYSF